MSDNKRKRKHKSKKIRRSTLSNQLSGGINSPPGLVDRVIPQQGGLYFLVPSSDKEKYEIFYNVTLKTESKGIKYTCTCTKTFENFGACRHIRAVIIFIAVDLIKNQSQTDDNFELITALNNFCISPDDIDDKTMTINQTQT